MLLQHTKNILERNGWSEQRRVDPSTDVALLTAAGFTVPDSIVALLSNLGGLNISLKGKPEFHFDIPATLQDLEFYDVRVEDISEIAGTPLLPIGMHAGGLNYILADENCRIFSGFDTGYNVTFSVDESGNRVPGESLEEFLDKLCSGGW